MAIWLTGVRVAMVGVAVWGMLEIVLGLWEKRAEGGKLGRLGWLPSKFSVENLLDKRGLGLLGAIITISCLGGLIYLRGVGNESVFEGRERIFQKAGMAFVQRPVLGWGVANFDYAFQSNDWPIKYNNDVYVDKAHSTVVENFVTLVVLGGLGFLGLIIVTLVQLVKLVKSFDKFRTSLDQFDYFNSMLLIIFILNLFHSQTNVISINEEIVFWIAGGIVASGRLLDKR